MERREKRWPRLDAFVSRFSHGTFGTLPSIIKASVTFLNYENCDQILMFGKSFSH